MSTQELQGLITLEVRCSLAKETNVWGPGFILGGPLHLILAHGVVPCTLSNMAAKLLRPQICKSCVFLLEVAGHPCQERTWVRKGGYDELC